MENWKTFWENDRRGPVRCSIYISNESQYSVNCMIVWELCLYAYTHTCTPIQMSIHVNTRAELCKFTHERYWIAEYPLNCENVFVFVFKKLYFHPNIVYPNSAFRIPFVRTTATLTQIITFSLHVAQKSIFAGVIVFVSNFRLNFLLVPTKCIWVGSPFYEMYTFVCISLQHRLHVFRCMYVGCMSKWILFKNRLTIKIRMK